MYRKERQATSETLKTILRKVERATYHLLQVPVL